MHRLKLFAGIILWVLALQSTASAQSVTGQISGVVVDPAGAIVAGASVQLTHDLSQTVHRFVSESNGSFVFTGLVPGTYSLRVSHPGFKSADQKGIDVAAQERVDMHEVRLEVGEVTSTVTVQADAVHVATDSSDRSMDMNMKQILDDPTRGRNPVSLIMMLPGVQSLAQSYDYRGWNGGGIPGVNGGQQGQIILNMDGAASQDSGNLNTGYINPSVDSIGEVKLLIENYTAEYGGRTAGQLTLTTKNGTAQFHGTAYDYYRDESLNANEFFNNLTNVTRPRYRYQNFGGTIGGPLVIPGTPFNKARQKLFFFFSYDKLFNTTVTNNTYTMPTALERAGNFSQTVTTTGVLIPVFDPTTQTPFPNNIIPANRISPQGQAMLNLFPMPAPQGLALDPTGNRGYNFRAVLPQSRPLDDKILRLDYNLSPKIVTYVRLLQDYQAQNGYNTTVGPPGGAWGQFPDSATMCSPWARWAPWSLHHQPDPHQRIELGHQSRQAGRGTLNRYQRRYRNRRSQNLCAEPAAAERRQRQPADAAAHQPGQQRPEPAAAGELRSPLRLQRPVLRPGCHRRPQLQPRQPGGLSPEPINCRHSRIKSPGSKGAHP